MFERKALPAGAKPLRSLKAIGLFSAVFLVSEASATDFPVTADPQETSPISAVQHEKVDLASVLMPPIEKSIISVEGDDYAIFVMRPPVPAPKEGFPVLVVVDANFNFAPAANSAWSRSIFAEIEPIIVVGIGFPTRDLPTFLQRRAKDFSDLGAQFQSEISRFGGTELGGAEVFREKVVKAALQLVDAKEHTNPRCRTLVGQSLGGLFAVSTLLHEPELFSGYYAASPSIQVEPNIVLEKERWQQNMSSIQSPVRVRLVVGELEGMGVSERQLKIVPEQRGKSSYFMISNLFRLSEILSETAPQNVEFTSEILRNESHLSISGRVISDAITFASQCPN